MMHRLHAVWFVLAVAGALLLAGGPSSVLSQSPPAKEPSGTPAKEPSGTADAPTPERPAEETPEAKIPGTSIELVVDSVKVMTWGPRDLNRLAEASGVRWRPTWGKGRDHPAIPIWFLLKEGGVAKDKVTEMRIIGGGKPRTFKGADLAKIDNLTLRAAANLIKNRPTPPKREKGGVWRAQAMDSEAAKANPVPSIMKVRRIEVVTTQ